MDILDRPENGGMMREMQHKVRQMKNDKIHMEALSAALKMELKNTELRQKQMEKIYDVLGPFGVGGV